MSNGKPMKEERMAKRMLADVLWTAANDYLPDLRFSCHATAQAALGYEWREMEWNDSRAIKFLRSLGCPDFASQCDAWSWLFDETEDFPREILDVRYMWLLLAMHVAEDEGITV